MSHTQDFHDSEFRLLTPAEMGRADTAAIASGIAGTVLMENAGAAVAQAIMSRWPPGRALVACGPGNNGGDGFVIARHLAASGWQVDLALAGERQALRGDAAWHAQQWQGDVSPLPETVLESVDLVVDALFGAGLARPLEGVVARFVESVNAGTAPVCAVDMPSGIDGATGQALGGLAVRADLTVTFFRKKPGHVLLPGRLLCGEVAVVDIGIPAHVLHGLSGASDEAGSVDPGTLVFENDISLWHDGYPWPSMEGHKYHRGHTVVIGGAVMAGAARLTATAAARIGSGLTTLLVSQGSLPLYASTPASIMLQGWQDDAGLHSQLRDPRKSAIAVGPGAGVQRWLEQLVLHVLSLRRVTVLDADALSVFEKTRSAASLSPSDLFRAIEGPCVLTPHEGEFARLFPSLAANGDKLSKTRQAARESGAIVLLKGADTVIAAPDGRAVINTNAPPTLATGGAGDVLTGMIAGLAAQGMPVFEAACAAAWLHGEVARAFGPGLIADDLPAGLPAVLRLIHPASGRQGMRR
ncbi:NAD(P)H-hydrate dehydratase [Paracandidimonas soli]|uniref:NAD(P)H-hydrate dehydratase n=1 Tax=Paracandidimonas soli TaxID=1917182 RepID=UPI00333FD00E